jgi:hypothetical protein
MVTIAPAALDHAGQEALEGQEGRGQAAVQGRLPVLLGDVGDRAGPRPPTAHERGQDVDRTEVPLHDLAHPFDRGRVGAVAIHPDRLAPALADRVGHGVEPGLVAAVDRHLGAVGGQQPAGGRTDAA